MRTSALAIATALALVAGVAAGQPAQDPAKDMAALQAVHAKDLCLVARAKAADDGVSDPNVIAARIAGSCHAEEDHALAAMNAWAARHGTDQDPPTLTDRDRLGLAREAVLMARGKDYRN